METITDHPDPQQIERVVRCEASAAEVRAVVRHLLRGCARCAAASAAFWDLLEGPPAQEAARGQSLRPYERFMAKHPAAGFWVEAGLSPRVAKALVQAGILALADVARLSREDFLAIRGVAEASLAHCEALLGHALPSIKSVWQESGLAPFIVHSLHRAGIDSLERFAAHTRESFLANEGLGDGTLCTCEALLGRKLDSPVRYWRGRGLSNAAARALSRARVRSVAELAALPLRVLAALGLQKADAARCKRLTGRL